MDQNDNIEKFFNKKFAGAVSEQDWNTPPEDTWDNIFEALEDKPDDKNFAFYIPWLIGMVLLIAASYLFISDKLQSERIDKLENKINNISPATGDINNNNTEETNRDLLIGSQDGYTKLISEKSVENSTSLQESNTQKTNQKKSKIKSSSIIQEIIPNGLFGLTAPTNNAKANATVSNLNSQAFNIGNNTIIPSNELALTSDKINQAILADKKIERNDILRKLNRLPFLLDIKERTKAESLGTKPYVKINQTKKFMYLGLASRHNQWMDVNTGFIANPLEELLTDEHTLSSLSYGLSASMNISKKWTANIDVLYNERSHKSIYFLQLPYSTNTEMLDADGEYFNAFQHSLPTSLGDVQTDVTLSRSQTSTLDNNEIVGIDLSFKNQTQSILIPISASYFIKEANNGLYLSGGLVNEIILNTNLSGIQSLSHHSKVNDKAINIQYDDTQQNKYGVAASLGLGYVWKLKAGTNIKLGASYDLALSNNYVFNGYQHKTNNYSAGLSVLKRIGK